jgi:hypothetical protein
MGSCPDAGQNRKMTSIAFLAGLGLDGRARLGGMMWVEAEQRAKYTGLPLYSRQAGAFALSNWRYKETITDEGVPIRNLWQEYKSRFSTSETALPPPGWTRHHLSESLPNKGMADTNFFYKHETDADFEF